MSRPFGREAEWAAAEATVGERLRQKRLEQGMSLRELARRIDVSASLVSQIETGKIQPSVRTLYAIVTELGVSLDSVFAAAEAEAGAAPGRTAAENAHGVLPDPGRGGVTVQPAGERPVIELETNVRWERLMHWRELDVEFLWSVYKVGGESSPENALTRHNGFEFGTILSGTLHVQVGFDTHVLEPGDSISFDSNIPHRLYNEGDETVTSVWVVWGRSGKQ